MKPISACSGEGEVCLSNGQNSRNCGEKDVGYVEKCCGKACLQGASGS